MNQLDFSSVLAVIRYYSSPDHNMNQGELLDELIDTRRRSQKNGELQLIDGLIKCADC